MRNHHSPKLSLLIAWRGGEAAGRNDRSRGHQGPFFLWSLVESYRGYRCCQMAEPGVELTNFSGGQKKSAPPLEAQLGQVRGFIGIMREFA